MPDNCPLVEKANNNGWEKFWNDEESGKTAALFMESGVGCEIRPVTFRLVFGNKIGAAVEGKVRCEVGNVHLHVEQTTFHKVFPEPLSSNFKHILYADYTGHDLPEINQFPLWDDGPRFESKVFFEAGSGLLGAVKAGKECVKICFFLPFHLLQYHLGDLCIKHLVGTFKDLEWPAVYNPPSCDVADPVSVGTRYLQA